MARTVYAEIDTVVITYKCPKGHTQEVYLDKDMTEVQTRNIQPEAEQECEECN